VVVVGTVVVVQISHPQEHVFKRSSKLLQRQPIF